jgi:hypothetical protein
MFDFWLEMPAWARVVLGIVLILAAVVLFLGGAGTRFPVIVGAIGLVCVLFAGAGNDKSGYNF